MLIKTILNQVYHLKSFVYGAVRLLDLEGGCELEVEVAPRANSKPICRKCSYKGGCYDRQPPRRYEFVPLWGMKVFLVYAARRVNCPGCGVVVEYLPWADGKSPQTIPYRLFIAHWAEKLSWQEVAREFRTTWDAVYFAVKYVVDWGLKHRDLSGILAIGVDEIMTNLGHHYATVVYQLDGHCRRLLWVGKERTAKTLLRFFREMGPGVTGSIKYVCSDMWKPYLKVIAKKLPQALHILDRFHIVANLNKALDEVRAQETKRLSQLGYEPVLSRSRWCFLKRPENLTQHQRYTLRELLQYNLCTVRAYLLKEDFQQLWQYTSATWAGKFLKAWCTRALRSRIEPIKKQARSIRRHQELILNWFRTKKRFSCGIVEGFNCKAKLTIRKAYGFRTISALETALYHQLGHLPRPPLAHRFF